MTARNVVIRLNLKDLEQFMDKQNASKELSTLSESTTPSTSSDGSDTMMEVSVSGFVGSGRNSTPRRSSSSSLKNSSPSKKSPSKMSSLQSHFDHLEFGGESETEEESTSSYNLDCDSVFTGYNSATRSILSMPTLNDSKSRRNVIRSPQDDVVEMKVPKGNAPSSGMRRIVKMDQVEMKVIRKKSEVDELCNKSRSPSKSSFSSPPAKRPPSQRNVYTTKSGKLKFRPPPRSKSRGKHSSSSTVCTAPCQTTTKKTEPAKRNRFKFFRRSSSKRNITPTLASSSDTKVESNGERKTKRTSSSTLRELESMHASAVDVSVNRYNKYLDPAKNNDCEKSEDSNKEIQKTGSKGKRREQNVSSIAQPSHSDLYDENDTSEKPKTRVRTQRRGSVGSIQPRRDSITNQNDENDDKSKTRSKTKRRGSVGSIQPRRSSKNEDKPKTRVRTQRRGSVGGSSSPKSRNCERPGALTRRGSTQQLGKHYSATRKTSCDLLLSAAAN